MKKFLSWSLALTMLACFITGTLGSCYAPRSNFVRKIPHAASPNKKLAERKDSIENEVRLRVINAGGQYDNVDIRVSLIWDNSNDLDLYVVDPNGRNINFRTYCREDSPTPEGGYLDVDRMHCMKPVENVIWPKGKAPKGHYKVYVQNFSTYDDFPAATEFKVELEINRKIQHFKLKTPPDKTREESNTIVAGFDYNLSEKFR